MKLVAIHAAVLVASLSYSEGFKILEDSGPSKTAATLLADTLPLMDTLMGGYYGGCRFTLYGCCSDGVTRATSQIDPCKADTLPLIGGCRTTLYGCCSDGVTGARSASDPCKATTTTTTTTTPATVPVPGKKGVGLGDSWGKSAAKTLSALKVFWFYNWGAMNDVPGTTAQYVPMAYDAASTAKLLSAPLGQVILGFNEPDNVKRAVMTPQAALDLWPKVTSLLSPNVKTWLGAPAPAHDPTVAANTWLPTFLAGKPTDQTAGPKVDFITLHWYKGANAQLFMNDVAALYNKYKLPIWITEFCPQDHASAMANPTAYTQPQVTSFITTVIPWLESQPYVQAYAWHDPSYGTCSLFDSSTGGLSATGLVYASATR